MRRELAKPMRPDTLSDDAALPLSAFFRGYRIIFDPDAIAYDYPALAGTEGRRRFRNLAGLWQTFVRNPQLFTSSRMRFHFLSHKFGRLMLPWALLLVLVGSIMLGLTAGQWWPLIAEVALVALAWIDGIVPKGFRLKRLTSPARTFRGYEQCVVACGASVLPDAGKVVDADESESERTAASGQRGSLGWAKKFRRIRPRI